MKVDLGKISGIHRNPDCGRRDDKGRNPSNQHGKIAKEKPGRRQSVKTIRAPVFLWVQF